MGRRLRIAVGGIAHETAGVLDGATMPGSSASFTPSAASFTESALRGAALTIEATLGGTIAGYLQGCDEQGMEAVPLSFVSGGSGGPITADTLRLLIAEELVAPLRAALPVDGVLVGLHGSFAAQGVDDADGEVLRAIRDVVGPSMPIYAALDQHCNVSQLMVDNTDVLSVMRTYLLPGNSRASFKSIITWNMEDSCVPMFPGVGTLMSMAPSGP